VRPRAGIIGVGWIRRGAAGVAGRRSGRARSVRGWYSV